MRQSWPPVCFGDEGWGMYGVELYAAVRLAVVEEGLSHHEAGRRFGIDRRTVKKMLSYSAPPGYRRRKPVRRPKLDGFTGIIDAILEADAGSGRAAQAAAHGKPDFRAAARRARVHGRVYDPDRVKTLGWGGDGALGHRDLRRIHVIWRFGAGSPVEGAPGLRGSMCAARFWPDSRLMPSRRRSRREHRPERSRGGCCTPAP